MKRPSDEVIVAPLHILARCDEQCKVIDGRQGWGQRVRTVKIVNRTGVESGRIWQRRADGQAGDEELVTRQDGQSLRVRLGGTRAMDALREPEGARLGVCMGGPRMTNADGVRYL